MNTQILEQKLELLKTFDCFESIEIERFGKSIKALSDLERHRMNPIRFAETYGFQVVLMNQAHGTQKRHPTQTTALIPCMVSTAPTS